MIDWKNVKTIFIDMDGTILDLYFDNYIWIEAMPLEYAKVHNISTEEAKIYIKKHIFKTSGSLKAYCFNYWSNLLSFDLMKIYEREKHRIKYRPHAEFFLKTIKNLDVNMFILTNAFPENIKLKLTVIDLSKYFDKIYSSHQYGFAKEQLDFWIALSKTIKFEPTNSLLIDDNIASLRAAKELGITKLFGISKPCSQSAAIETDEFMLINNFMDVMPKIDNV